MPLVAAIIAPLLTWFVKFAMDKSFALAMAAFVGGVMLAYIGAMSVIIGLISSSVPSSITDVLNVVIPSQWVIQSATIVSIQATYLMQKTFNKMISTFAQTK